MKRHPFLAVSTAVLTLVPAMYVLAADAPPAQVTFSGEANMPTLRDEKQIDRFDITLGDSQVITTFSLQCKAGTRSLGGLLRSDEECAVSGDGFIINPRNPNQKLPRTQYAGGFTVKADGSTDLSRVTVNYLPLGKVPASSETLAGVLNLKPENPSPTAGGLKESILKRLRDSSGQAGSLVDERVDSVEIPDLYIPSAGLTSDKGCTWRGNMAFAYQTDSWFMNLEATCSGKTYSLKGNMPWVDAPSTPDRTQYNLILTLPSTNAVGDDALFAAPAGDGDLFATADGISGTIFMDESRYVDTEVDGKMERLPMYSKISGSLSGQGVPLETVRSFSQMIAVLARTFFGA